MINSIIFDLGRVLLTFEPVEYLHKLYGRGEKSQALYKAVFGSKTWLDLDRGTVNNEDAIRIMTGECSEYADEIRYLMNNWLEIVEPIEANLVLLNEFKEKGYKLFLLSNFHREAFDMVFKKFDFFGIFNGIFISSHYGLLKPEREIYVKMLREFSLNPHECIFIDDSPANISAAKELGIEGIVFTDPETLRQELIKYKVLKGN